ncbi:MAG: subunit of TIM23 translocase complex [Candelina submexicana]|nr:MAG: subunit of TIM23 translocase complex [Candelina submexicana]
MPPPPRAGGAGGMTTFDKLKMGAMMGSSVGLIIGFIFGSVNIIRFGAGPNGLMRTLGQYMLGSGATFGFVLPPQTYTEVAAPNTDQRALY